MSRDDYDEYEDYEGEDFEDEDFDEEDFGPSMVEYCPKCDSRHTEFIKFSTIAGLVGGVVVGVLGAAIGSMWESTGSGGMLGFFMGMGMVGVGFSIALPRMWCSKCNSTWRTGYHQAQEMMAYLPAVGIASALMIVVCGILAAIELGKRLGDDDETILNTEIEEPEEDPFDPDIERDIEEIDRPEEEVEEPTEDPQIDPEAVDENNEDPTDDPTEEMSDNPNDALNDSPFTNLNANSALGTGASGIGGGGKFGGRGGGKRARARGGSRRTESAVMAGLMWLKRHQSPDGGWRAKGFHEMCGKDPSKDRKGLKWPGVCANLNGTDDTGWEVCDSGVTGLALLAFLGAGHTHQAGKFKATVRKGLKYVMNIQNADGSFGPQDQHQGNYNHSICVMALAEAYGMTGFARLRPVAQKGVDFIVKAQNDGLGWRYGVKPGDNDSSLSGWMVLALKSSKIAGLKFPHSVYEGALAWYDIVTDPAYGKVGYTQRGGQQSRLPDKQQYDQNEALAGVAIFSRLAMGMSRKEPALKLGADAIVQDLPQWEPETKIDMYYWYYGTLAIFQMDDPWWTKWNNSMKTTLVENQRQGSGQAKDPKGSRTRNDADGSWDPIGAWGSAGGRVYSTAINVLSLEIYYRYGKLGAKK